MNTEQMTQIPGAKGEKLLKRKDNIVPRAISCGSSTFAESANGTTIKDVDGNEFLDFAGAIGTINVGHSHPKVVEAISEQASRFVHTGFNVMMYESYIELAERIAELAPGEHEKKVAFFNSGAEAVENAVKVARKATGRKGIITFNRGFHGRTLMTMSMTSKVKPYKFEFGPFAPEVYRGPYPYLYRKPDEIDSTTYSKILLSQLDELITTEISADQVAAVVLEPVQGEGGFIVPDATFIQGVADICKKHGILLVADEIQTGFARCGRYFAIDHFDVVPDLITISKSMGAGVPISGLIGRKDLMDAAEPGELGGTYAGSPLGCQAALAVLDIIEEENLNERSAEIGDIIRARMEQLQGKYPQIGDIRGLGAMCAVEIVKDPELKEPDPDSVAHILKEANRLGLLLLKSGVYSNVIRFLSPLTLSDEELDRGLNIVEESMSKVWG
ncbi:4-aminobutyrate--2-oxoglutarate transaminase [Halobacillus salinus]|uniref:(S)-3-amino-2-methylpropionate transaminase n=1 Tax=Halobacillus salinus TaxID=192814 RepID=A0A4Z0GZ22_9BACI|nr:4-aminobutyrate--2-oxoglutarate transaminase [Halobacillus salinus]TGB02461.1 4-aminobutyrate--2-oxoglutarate transaminase [Halobacillus salinus]